MVIRAPRRSGAAACRVRVMPGGFKLAGHSEHQAAEPAEQARILDPHLGSVRLRPVAVRQMVQLVGQSRGNRPVQFRAHCPEQPLDAGQGLRWQGLRAELLTRLAEQGPHAQDAIG